MSIRNPRAQTTPPGCPETPSHPATRQVLAVPKVCAASPGRGARGPLWLLGGAILLNGLNLLSASEPEKWIKSRLLSSGLELGLMSFIIEMAFKSLCRFFKASSQRLRVRQTLPGLDRPGSSLLLRRSQHFLELQSVVLFLTGAFEADWL